MGFPSKGNERTVVINKRFEIIETENPSKISSSEEVLGYRKFLS